MEYPFKDLLPLDEVLEREGYYKDWTHLDPEVFYSLTQISNYIKTKGFGVDVRLLIAQLAEHFSLKTAQINQIELFFKDVMQELAEDKDFYSLPEIVGARGGFDTLGKRLDDTTLKLAQKVGLGKKAELEDLSANVLSAIQGGAGTSFNLLSVPQKKSVSPDTTTFIKTSLNLLDRESSDWGKFVNPSGEIEDRPTTHVLSHRINVYPKVVINTSHILSIAWYDASDNFISWEGSTTAQRHQFFFTAPDNAYFVRANISQVDAVKEKVKLSLTTGTDVVNYAPFQQVLDGTIKLDDTVVEIENANFIERSSNFINIDNMTTNSIIRATGVIEEEQSYSFSHKIRVEPEETYNLSFVTSVAWYTKDDVFIRRDGVLYADIENAFLKAPPMARIARANVQNVYILSNEEIKFAKGSLVVPFEPYYLNIDSLKFPTTEETEVADDDKGFILDLEIPHEFETDVIFEDWSETWGALTSTEIYGMFDELITEFPNNVFTKYKTATDHEGLEMSAYKLTPERVRIENNSKPKKRPKVFITCGVHGGEKVTTLVMYNLLKQLNENWKSDIALELLRFNFDLIFIPIVNPSGWNVGTRINTRGVDLNHNPPTKNWKHAYEPFHNYYPGDSPGSELETQFVMEIFDENKDIDIYFDYHSFGDYEEDDRFIWLIVKSDLSDSLAQSYLARMTRKFKKDFDWVPYTTYSNGYVSNMERSRMDEYAYEQGIEQSSTLETRQRWMLEPEIKLYSQNTIKSGLESVVHYLLMNLKVLAE